MRDIAPGTSKSPVLPVPERVVTGPGITRQVPG